MGDVLISVNADSGVADSAETTACVQQDAASVLQLLRQRGAGLFLAAAQRNELQPALQVAANRPGVQPVLQNPRTDDVLIPPVNADSGVADLAETTACVQQDAASVLQLLRQRASLAMAAAAHTSDLGTMLQSVSSTTAPQAMPAMSSKMPPRTPSKTPTIPKAPSSTSLSQGYGTLGRQTVPTPTGLPAPSG